MEIKTTFQSDLKISTMDMDRASYGSCAKKVADELAKELNGRVVIDEMKISYKNPEDDMAYYQCEVKGKIGE